MRVSAGRSTFITRKAVLTLFMLVSQVLFGETTVEEVAGEGLKVESLPSGAKVFIDGIEKGLTPFESLSVSEGSHSLHLTKDNYNDWQRRVTVGRDGRLSVYVELVPARGEVQISLRASTGETLNAEKAYIQVESLPQKAVLRENKLVVSLSEGQKTITVNLFGWEAASKTVQIKKNEIEQLDFELNKASLKLERPFLNRKIINPKNEAGLGNLVFNFRINAPAYCRLLVFNESGKKIFSVNLAENTDGSQAPLLDWMQNVIWDGRETSGAFAPEGRYRLRVEAAPAPFASAGAALPKDGVFCELYAEINYNAQIIPLNQARLAPGLAYAEYSQTLAAHSFQIEAALNAGGALNAEDGEERGMALLDASFRFAPVSLWEICAALEFMPDLKNNKNSFAAGLSARRELLRNSAIIPGISLGSEFCWVDRARRSGAGIYSGFALRSAFNWNLTHGFTIIVSPALRWSGEQGYPSEAAPQLEAGGGLMFSTGQISAGMSARSGFIFAQNINLPAEFAAELRCLLSNFTISAALHSKFNKNSVFLTGELSLGVIF